MKFFKPFFYLISCIIFFLIISASLSYGQYEPDSSNILKFEARKYLYGGTVYKKSKLKEIINSSEDEKAIRLYSKYKTLKIIGPITTGVVNLLSIHAIVKLFRVKKLLWPRKDLFKKKSTH